MTSAAKIVSFEPLASEFGRLATMAASDGNWDAHHFALGEASGANTINVFSSIQPLSRAANEFDDRTVVRRTETIRVCTLDEVFPDLSGNVLLKIDTQGYEKQVLEGGRRLLPRLKGVLLELPIIWIYEGTWKFHEAAEFMASIGVRSRTDRTRQLPHQGQGIARGGGLPIPAARAATGLLAVA